MTDESARVQQTATSLTSAEEILGMVKGTPQPRPDLANPAVPPRSETERKLVDLWAEALGLKTLGVEDDFFALGGHSLLISHILSRVRDEFEVEIPLSAWFETSFTVAELARQIELAQIELADQRDVNEVLEAVAGLSDEEVEKMLAQRSK